MRTGSTRRWARIACVATAVTLVTALTACGHSDPGRFDAGVAEVRAAVDAGDRAGALDALDRLARDGLVAYQDDAIDEDQVQEMAQLIDSSRALIDEVLPADSVTASPATTTVTAPPTTVATAPAPTAAPKTQKGPAPKGEDHGGKEKGHGKH